jgi:hypothetical protein
MYMCSWEEERSPFADRPRLDGGVGYRCPYTDNRTPPKDDLYNWTFCDVTTFFNTYHAIIEGSLDE